MLLSTHQQRLHWLIHSPAPILPAQDLPLVDEAVLKKLWTSSTEISFESIPQRLGHLAEAYLSYGIDHSSEILKVLSHLQIIEDGITRGEIDYIVQYLDQLYHWELAVKFYLYTTTENGPEFIGPSVQDCLSRKLNHLQQHQLPMGQHPQVLERIFGNQKHGEEKPERENHTRENLIEEKLNSQLIFKGRLFYPLGEDLNIGESLGPKNAPHTWEDFCFRQNLNPLHLRGWWIHQHQWPDFIAERSKQGEFPMRLLKPDWLSSDLRVPEIEAWTPPTWNTFQVAFFRKVDGFFEETSRGFVVPDTWPKKSSSL